MSRESKLKRKHFENEIKDRVINILLELLKANNIEIPEPIIETLEHLYGVQNDRDKKSS